MSYRINKNFRDHYNGGSQILLQMNNHGHDGDLDDLDDRGNRDDLDDLDGHGDGADRDGRDREQDTNYNQQDEFQRIQKPTIVADRCCLSIGWVRTLIDGHLSSVDVAVFSLRRKACFSSVVFVVEQDYCGYLHRVIWSRPRCPVRELLSARLDAGLSSAFQKQDEGVPSDRVSLNQGREKTDVSQESP